MKSTYYVGRSKIFSKTENVTTLAKIPSMSIKSAILDLLFVWKIGYESLFGWLPNGVKEADVIR